MPGFGNTVRERIFRSGPQSLLIQCTKFFDRQEYGEAVRCFDGVLEKYPRCAEGHYRKGWTLNRLGLYEEAIRCFDTAIALQPGYKEALFQKANSCAYLARFEEAILLYDQVLAIDPQSADTWSNKAICYRRLGDAERYMACMDEVAKAKGEFQCRLMGGT
jgi:tetratricopeptide (TPR) repeat protein